MAYLSKQSILSYCGDVLPLELLDEEDLTQADIKWYTEGNIAYVRTFTQGHGDGFSNGVLVTLIKEGSGAVCAQFAGEIYRCPVTVRPARKAQPGEKLQYYTADLHVHTSNIHRHDPFAARTGELPEELVYQLGQEQPLDCCVITDHAGVMLDRDFFRGFLAEEKISHDGIVIFPGAEGSLTPISADRLGCSRKQFGEMLTLNLDNYIYGGDMTAVSVAVSQNHMGIGAFVHPQIIGYDACGIWNCAARENATDELKNLIRLVEMGTGAVSESSMTYEFVYSEVLDCGFRVAPECASDSHAHYTPCPGKTVILAPDKSRELFLDAIRNCRVYATSSGNVRLNLSVNGCPMGAALPLTDTYDFHVELGQFRADEGTKPVKCQVISDYGLAVKTVDCTGRDTLDFTVKSDTARYFYLRLVDNQGRKTWSAPVWTGRAFDDLSVPELIALDKSDFSAVQENTGCPADILLNNDPRQPYESGCTAPSIVIDMKKVQQICAIGHAAPILLRRPLMDAGIDIAAKTAQLVSRFRVLVSSDGGEYTPCFEGMVRMFGREEIFTFPETAARYVKFQVLSSVGKESEEPGYADATVTVGELTVFGKAE